MKKIIFVLFLLLIFFGGCDDVDKSSYLTKSRGVSWDDLSPGDWQKENYYFPVEYTLTVPFVMQAPLANWSEHNESCEEAGILLAHYYYIGEELTVSLADWEIKDMVDYQNKYYGGEFDIYAAGITQLARDYYGEYEPRVLVGNVENMKAEILAGNPIIVPTTAAALKMEKSDYPEMGYHVVLVVGYNERGFVTHDVGTYSGANFTYSYATLLRSMADYGNEVVVLK
ncbi:MAG: C39 family peptidase [Patescibacteria group bacterium]